MLFLCLFVVEIRNLGHSNNFHLLSLSLYPHSFLNSFIVNPEEDALLPLIPFEPIRYRLEALVRGFLHVLFWDGAQRLFRKGLSEKEIQPNFIVVKEEGEVGINENRVLCAALQVPIEVF